MKKVLLFSALFLFGCIGSYAQSSVHPVVTQTGKSVYSVAIPEMNSTIQTYLSEMLNDYGTGNERVIIKDMRIDAVAKTCTVTIQEGTVEKENIAGFFETYLNYKLSSVRALPKSNQ